MSAMVCLYFSVSARASATSRSMDFRRAPWTSIVEMQATRTTAITASGTNFVLSNENAGPIDFLRPSCGRRLMRIISHSPPLRSARPAATM